LINNPAITLQINLSTKIALHWYEDKNGSRLCWGATCQGYIFRRRSNSLYQLRFYRSFL